MILQAIYAEIEDLMNERARLTEKTAALSSACKNLKAEIEELRSTLGSARLQIQYLHEKFQETGTGNTIIARIDAELLGVKGDETLT